MVESAAGLNTGQKALNSLKFESVGDINGTGI